MRRYGLSAFNQKFGVLQPNGTYEISAVSKIGIGYFSMSTLMTRSSRPGKLPCLWELRSVKSQFLPLPTRWKGLDENALTP